MHGWRSPSKSLDLRNCKKEDGMSMLRSRKGSCFFEDVLQLRQVTSDCRVPPKIDVTSDCVDALALAVLLNRLKKKINNLQNVFSNIFCMLLNEKKHEKLSLSKESNTKKLVGMVSLSYSI